MPAEQHFQPDGIYCAYCHAPAAGACASCKAIVCADCSAVVTGAGGKSWAVCERCDEAGPVTLVGLFQRLAVTALPFLAGAAALVLLWWIFRS